MRYILVSHKRADNQVTIKHLTPSILSKVELWVHPSQYKEYSSKEWVSKLHSINCWPEYLDCIPKKRLWSFLNWTDEPFMFLEDDLTIQVWDPKVEKFLSARNNQKLFEKRFLGELAEAHEKYSNVGLAFKFMAAEKAKRGLFHEGVASPMCMGFGSEEVCPREGINTNYVLDYQDTAIPLELQIKHQNSATYYGLVVNASVAKVMLETGMSTYRKPWHGVDSAMKLMRRFPGIVVGFEQNGNNFGGLSIRKFFSRAGKEITEAQKKVTADNLAAKREEFGLLRNPDIYRWDFEESRDDILSQFKANWRAAKQPV